MARLLPRSFYSRPPDAVAHALLGKILERRLRGQRLCGRIVEVEAYFGKDDPAAHSAAGKTARNAVLFGPPGHAYVYFIYGMYSCMNVSCEPEGQAGCVLLRALEPLSGMETMTRLRGLSHSAKPRMLTTGPGRLCQALGIVRATHNGLDLTDPASELQIRDDGFRPVSIRATPRIGIRKAVEHPHRFLIEENGFVSR
ncbi:MAG: DNA-3-methyladenine glycosylase [Acidobacteriaceae bacterium]